MFVQKTHEFEGEMLQYQVHNIHPESKQTLVFIHGYGLGFSIFNDVIAELAKQNSCITLSLPGFDSSEPPKSYALDSISERVSSCLEDIGISNYVLVGHSLGGYIGLEMLNQKTVQMKGLVLLHSHCFGDSVDRQVERKQVAEFILKHGTQIFVKEAFKKVFTSNHHNLYVNACKKFSGTEPSVLAEYALAMATRENRALAIQNSEIPIHLISGEFDAIIERKTFAEMAALIPSGSWNAILQTGHISTLEQVDAFCKVIDDILEKF